MGVRNEALRLPFLFDYYRTQGVDRFFVADDGSDDGTREWLLDQPATHVFAPDSDWVSAVSGLTWLTALMAEAEEEVAREAKHAGSEDFDAYAARLAAEPDLCLTGPDSVAFRDSAQLVRLGIMRSSPGWDTWPAHAPGAP